MQTILNIYKPQGLTPLQTINLLREKRPEYKDVTIGFAGRLDPLAHGVLLLMVDKQTTKEKDKFLNLPKEYEFEALFGISTDTYDALGLVNNITMNQWNDDFSDLRTTIENFIKSKQGKHTQQYPPYSSKTVLGKPLYLWARQNKLSEITIPERDIEIKKISLLKMKDITSSDLKTAIMQKIDSVDGDFRQREIKEKWQTFFEKNNDQIFITARFIVSCSSGTYIRSLVHELGKTTGLEAIALEIIRTKVGEYNLKDSLQLT